MSAISRPSKAGDASVASGFRDSISAMRSDVCLRLRPRRSTPGKAQTGRARPDHDNIKIHVQLSTKSAVRVFSTFVSAGRCQPTI